MLIKMPEEKKPIFRLYLSSYTEREIDNIFADKTLCTTCPFLLIWSARMFEGAKEVHRGYCKLNHFSLIDLPAILGLSIEETWNQVALLHKKSELAPDVVKIHPHARERFVVSCILTKEQDMCQLDLYAQGKTTLSEEILTNIKEWRKKYLKK